MGFRRACGSPAVVLALLTALCVLAATSGRAQTNQGREQACCAPKHDGKREERSPKRAAAAARFGERAEPLLDAAPSSKGDWGLLIVDAQTGETLFEKSADGYFVPASNMKLFTTALAGQAGAGLQIPHYSRNARHDFAERDAFRRCCTSRARRSESFQPQVSIRGEGGTRGPTRKNTRGAGGRCGGARLEGDSR